MWVPLLIEELKTWMNGVFKPRQQPPSSQINRKQSNSTTTKTLRCSRVTFNVTPALVAASATSSSSSPPPPPPPSRSSSSSSLTAFFDLFFECVFCQLTSVLMNDFRLKTFYCKTSSKSSAATATASTATLSSSSSLSINKFTPSSNNNHHRTYNNSSKSNKVFLYYTPRDPRLRIFKKTKQFSNRPQCSEVFPTADSSRCSSYLRATATKCLRYSDICRIRSGLSKISDDLCNYGELIGGRSEEIYCFIGFEQQKPQQQQEKEKENKNNKVESGVKNLLIISNNCDNSLIEKVKSKSSDKCVVAAAIFDNFIAIANIVAERHLTELLIIIHNIGAFLSIFLTIVIQRSKLFSVITTTTTTTTIAVYEKI